MKKYFFIYFILVGCFANAQQKPHYTQYVLNNFIINPALAGIENYWDVKVSHRQQWVGLNDAPTTTYLSFHGPLKKSNYPQETSTGFRTPGSNPRGAAYWLDYNAVEPHHGMGFTAINDATGPLTRMGAYASYAYHMGIAPRTNFAMGFSVGFSNWQLNTSKLNFGNTNVDPAVAGSGMLNKWRPELQAGLWLYSADYFIGVAAQQIWPQRIVYANNTVAVAGGNSVPHIFFQAGQRVDVSEDVNIIPSVMVRYINPLPLGIDANLKMMYRDIFWLGTSYRYKDGFAGLIGININGGLNIGYSYDLTTSRLNTVSKGTHEIMIGFLLGNNFGDWCPRNLW